ncbi:hypothetical protein KR074_006358 [Drosophila pseudoananassae]|nr:hypothetical protein KR074_006358 [Drosophila pseudoananassae]
MHFFASINLILYNGLVYYLATHIKRDIGAPNNEFSLWFLIPIAGRIVSSPQAVNENRKVSDVLWKINFYLNLFLLLPGMFRRRHINLILGVILICNIFVFERLVLFFGYFLWVLWGSDMKLVHYVTLAFFGVFINAVHLAAIGTTLKLHMSQFSA